MSDPYSADKTILVAVDLHKGSNLVMARALAYAAKAGATLHLASIAEPNIANVRPPETLDAPELTGTDVHKLREFIEHRCHDFRKHHPEVECPIVELHVDTGDPAEKIVGLASKLAADLIVLGTHGRTGIKRLLIGSVAEKVVRLAGCPVLVIREKRHEPATN